MGTPTLHLVVPGLLGPWARAVFDRERGQSLSSLRRLLTRADVSPCPGDEFALTASIAGFEDAPTGPVCALGDDLDVGDAVWFRVLPVNLQVDIHHLLLTDPRKLAVTADEQSELRRQITDSGILDGMGFETGSSGRWYLKVETDPTVTTQAPYAAVGRDITPWMPQGPWAQGWMARLTELQMFLHQCDCNRRREQAGALPINSLWLWGNGRCPVKRRAASGRLFADGPFARGLARLTALETRSQPEGWECMQDELDAPGPTVVVIDGLRWLAHLDDVRDAMETAMIMERTWFAPMVRDLARLRKVRIVIHDADGRRFRPDRWTDMRVWRRAAPKL